MTDITNDTSSELRIDQELRDWIIPLKPEEYSELEKSILSDGCRDPLVIWNGVIADGHHRFKICTENGIPFNTVEKSFESKDDVKLWMVRNQIARRNLESIQRIALVMKGEDLISARARENLKTAEPGVRGGSPLVNLPNPIEPTLPSPEPTHTQTTPKVITQINTRKEAATLAKVSEKTYAKGKEVLQKATPEVVAKVMSGDVSIHKAYTDIRREEKKGERQKNIVENPVIPDGKYDVILADPPWQYQFSETQTREIENQYPTMKLEDIKNMVLPIEDSAVLFLWATAPKLEEAISVIKAWGFTYKTCAIWDKEVIGMGYWFRIQHELLLVGVKGTFRSPEPEDRVSSIIKSRRSTHSTKPDVVYEILEKMLPNRKYLEVFARSTRDGWASWGNQL
jgi:N6-adenosine-specific RNA methylase IME4/ParB-like chromosome segregation protein Spo0J